MSESYTGDFAYYSRSAPNADLNAPGILVTGGTGLLGSHLLQRLVKERKKVKALYRSTIPHFAGSEGVEWLHGDILDITLLEEILTSVDQVYHCAGIVSFSPENKHEMFVTNIEGTANVVNASLNAGVTKMVYVSSVAVLGKPVNGAAIDEKNTPADIASESNYAKSKYLAEAEVWRGIGEGLNAVIVNPSIILGAGNWDEGSTKIFKTAYEEFPYYTLGTTGFVDVNDLVNAMIQLMGSNITAERFIVSSENLSYKDVFSKMATYFGKKPPQKKVSAFVADIVWRFESVRSLITGRKSILTKETAKTALLQVQFNNDKLKEFVPSFTYTPMNDAIGRICRELQLQYNLL